MHPHPWMPVVGYIAGTTVAGDEMTSSEMSIPFGRHASSSSLCPTNVMYSCASSHLIPPRAGTVVLKEDGHSKGKGKIERRQMARCALAPHWRRTQYAARDGHCTTLHGLSSYHDSNVVALVFVWSCLSRTLPTYVPSWPTAHNTHPGPVHPSHPSLPQPRAHRLLPLPSCNTGMLSPST